MVWVAAPLYLLMVWPQDLEYYHVHHYSKSEFYSMRGRVLEIKRKGRRDIESIYLKTNDGVEVFKLPRRSLGWDVVDRARASVSCEVQVKYFVADHLFEQYKIPYSIEDFQCGHGFLFALDPMVVFEKYTHGPTAQGAWFVYGMPFFCIFWWVRDVCKVMRLARPLTKSNHKE